MKKNVLIWVIIAVVAIAIIVGGYFAFRSLTKKPNSGEGDGRGGSSFKPYDAGTSNTNGSKSNIKLVKVDKPSGSEGTITIQGNVYDKDSYDSEVKRLQNMVDWDDLTD